MLVWCVICRSVGRSVFALGVFSPNCSGETWPRQQEVISRRAATVVIHHHADGCLSLRYRLEDCAGGEPKQCGQSMRAFHSPWTSAFWSSPLIGRALLRYCWDFFFFFCSVLWKGVGGEWWTLWCWQPAELLADVHGICARILLCSPLIAKNPQISLRGLIQICTLISVHIIPS